MKPRNELEKIVVERAMKDEDFRKRLIEDSKAALEQETGIRIPDSVNIKVLEEDSQTFYLVLPPKSNSETEDELTEADLRMVSGGYAGENDTSGGIADSCSPISGLRIDCNSQMIG